MSELDYLLGRVHQELAMAAASLDPRAASIHLALAEAYCRRIARGEQRQSRRAA